MLLILISSVSIAAYVVSFLVSVTLYLSGRMPELNNLASVVVLHGLSALHGLTCLMVPLIPENSRLPFMIYIAFYGYFQTLLAWLYQLHIAGIFECIYPIITAKRIRIAMFAVFVLHLVMCVPLYYALFTAHLYRVSRWEQIYYNVGVGGFVTLAVNFDLLCFVKLTGALSNYMYHDQKIKSTRTLIRSYQNIRVLVIVIAIWDLLGFISMSAGELMHPTGEDDNISRGLKLFAVGTYNWHFVGMTYLMVLLKRWFKEALKVPKQGNLSISDSKTSIDHEREIGDTPTSYYTSHMQHNATKFSESMFMGG